MRTLQKFKLGTFEVTQPKLIISDPCYAPGTWCMGIVPNAQPGIWEAEIGFFHEGKHDAAVAYPGRVPSALPTQKPVNCTEELFKVGVDSGQAGVFDKPFYRAGADAGQIPSEDATGSVVQQLLQPDLTYRPLCRCYSTWRCIQFRVWGWRLYLLLLPSV